MKNVPKFQLNIGIEDVHLLYHCVCNRIENEKESPSNHPQEKKRLLKLKDVLYRMILEYKFLSD